MIKVITNDNNPLIHIKTEDISPVDAEMVEALRIVKSLRDVTGDCRYRFSNLVYIDDVVNKITSTYNITRADYMFYSNEVLVYIPFDINVDNSNISSIFGYCGALKEVPYVKGMVTSGFSSIFNRCYKLRYIPDDWFNYLIPNGNITSTSNVLGYCYSLRKIPSSFFLFLKSVNYAGRTTSGNFPYAGLFQNNYVLGEIENIPVLDNGNTTITTNLFGSCFSSVSRTKKITFEVNEDGTPKIARWNNQVLDLSGYMGYSNTINNFINYNSGLTKDNEVKDNATYQALKNTDDWFATSINYSRYNHISAVETINSLPDTKNYGINSIKFKRDCGKLTDGGAVGNLTADEIAIAAAKGWTVTIAA